MSDYFQLLFQSVSRGWNRFWFAAADPLPLGILRAVVGGMAFFYLAAFTPELVSWFGPEGMFPLDSVKALRGRWAVSLLDYISSPAALWGFHIASLIAAGLFAAGVKTTYAKWAALAAVLSYSHRAPMIAGQFEPVLSLALFYLCIGPCGAALSVDAWLAARGDAPSSAAASEGRIGDGFEPLTSRKAAPTPPGPTVAANLSLRLLQLHLALIYIMMGLSKTGGQVWWSGEGVWWLLARPDSRLVDLSFLARGAAGVYLLNAWTLLVLWTELATGVLVWNRLLRPIVLGLSTLCWLSLAAASGLVSFCLLMSLITLGAFIPADFWRSRLSRSARVAEPSARNSVRKEARAPVEVP